MTFPTSMNRSERLTAEQERDMARQIREAETNALAAVEHVDEAREVLTRRPERAERTRAGAVDRLEESVRLVQLAARKDPTLREFARTAKNS